MWVLLSSRLRTWVALAVAIPVSRFVLRRVGDRVAAGNPGSRTAAVLRRADSTLGRFGGRKASRG